REAPARALSDVRRGGAPARGGRPHPRALAGRQFRHFAGDGGVLRHVDTARRGVAPPVGRAGPHGGAAVGKVEAFLPFPWSTVSSWMRARTVRAGWSELMARIVARTRSCPESWDQCPCGRKADPAQSPG